MAGIRRAWQNTTTPSTMIEMVGLKRYMIIVVHIGMAGLARCRIGMMTSERQSGEAIGNRMTTRITPPQWGQTGTSALL